MTIQYIRDYYAVPAKVGGRVKFDGRSDGVAQYGTITGARSARLKVRLDGDTQSSFLHPTWKVEYLPDATGDPLPEGVIVTPGGKLVVEW